MPLHTPGESFFSFFIFTITYLIPFFACISCLFYSLLLPPSHAVIFPTKRRVFKGANFCNFSLLTVTLAWVETSNKFDKSHLSDPWLVWFLPYTEQLKTCKRNQNVRPLLPLPLHWYSHTLSKHNSHHYPSIYSP